MMSMRDMFYGEVEPVWIAKKDDDKKEKGDDKAKSEYSILSSVPFYPYYYYEYGAPSATKEEEKKKGKEKEKETKVELKVPMCCGECEESVTIAINSLKGVKSVECNTRKEKVTVIATSAAPADILMECRKLFKKSRMWTDDD